MGDQDERHSQFRPQPLEQLEDLRLDRDVERCGRCIGDEKPWVARERHGDHHSLAHPTAELVRKLVNTFGRRGNAHEVEQFDRAPARGPRFHAPMDLQRLADLAADCHDRVQV